MIQIKAKVGVVGVGHMGTAHAAMHACFRSSTISPGIIQQFVSDRMKVLLITPSYLPIIGGSELIARDLSIKLNDMGIHTDIMTLNMNEKWKPIWREEVENNGLFRVFKVPAFNPFGALAINPLYQLL